MHVHNFKIRMVLYVVLLSKTDLHMEINFHQEGGNFYKELAGNKCV